VSIGFYTDSFIRAGYTAVFSGLALLAACIADLFGLNEPRGKPADQGTDT
jgi:hypothetical protein